ncbi:YitT family protein [Sutterella sp.]|uniref:YczE/YyaS/YitT family protein n=1 Tax=Sutterella sp. TaxID=1981025 RepID=UPI0026E01DE9|nr:DUF6198 family protein [Sutterella sp.]MDO5532679.1 DUF6198 family protein [Sutterella sp.]
MSAQKKYSHRFRNLTGRLLMLLVGIELATLGIAFTTLSHLGTTPISTLPYVCSVIFPLSFGTTTFILNCGFFLLQVALLRKRFSPLNILQIPAVIVFSAFIDMNMHLCAPVVSDSWWISLMTSLMGNVFLAIGIFLQVRSKTIVQPGEGMVIAFATVLRKPFGTVKIWNDVTIVILACLLSLAVLGNLVGLREGTALSAVLVGLFVKVIAHFFPENRPKDEPHQVPLKAKGQELDLGKKKEG